MSYKIIIFLVLGLALLSSAFPRDDPAGNNTIVIRREKRGSPFAIDACRSSNNILSCHQVDVPSTLCANDNTHGFTFLGEEFSFEHHVQPTACSYSSKSGEAMLTPDCEDSSRCTYSGSIQLDDATYTIQPCFGNDCHVLKKLDLENMKEDKIVMEPTGEDYQEEMPHITELLARGARDTTTNVTISIKVYYTHKARASNPKYRKFKKFKRFVEEAIAETNKGYLNSRVPIQAKLHCIEKATLREGFEDMLYRFSTMKESWSKLRGGADVAVLLVHDLGYCGLAYGNYAFKIGKTISVVETSCATGYFSFGHEIAHNFGVDHNKEEGTNPYFSYGHGHLIDGGFRTILGYHSSGHGKRVNYYSNHLVKYRGAPTGIRGISNNARLLTENRFVVAALGDERGSC